jgi:hypothetical protein
MSVMWSGQSSLAWVWLGEVQMAVMTRGAG